MLCGKGPASYAASDRIKVTCGLVYVGAAGPVGRGEIKRSADQRGRRAIGIRHYYYASITERVTQARGPREQRGRRRLTPAPQPPVNSLQHST
ncbi:unnamed protein product [Pieris brassicae]|uniref:Uncharacterized protein n=1 Tax=Pieris brassicae TaxID=7116 RepID=A0A9P0TRN1_PIEBR|nr:unnamed protein product [Pieris brassicae]